MRAVSFFTTRDDYGWLHNRKAPKRILAKQNLDCRFAPLVFRSEATNWIDGLVLRIGATALLTHAIDDYTTDDREEHYTDVFPFGAFLNADGELTVYVWCKSSSIKSKFSQCDFDDLRGGLMVYEHYCHPDNGERIYTYNNTMLSLRTRLQPLSKR